MLPFSLETKTSIIANNDDDDSIIIRVLWFVLCYNTIIAWA